MMQDWYKWEAERQSGEVITSGENLAGCVRFSLIPTLPSLPRHDIVGVPMRRRLGRGFIAVFGKGLKDYVHCVVCDECRIYIRSSNGTVLVSPRDYELYL